MMELVSTDVSPDDFFLEPIQYVFRDGDSELIVSFIPTVPHGAEAEHLYGDLFACRGNAPRWSCRAEGRGHCHSVR